MRLEIAQSVDEAARRGAALIARAVETAVEQRGYATVAVSGGHTPWAMLRELAGMPLPWDSIRFFQVDERDCDVDDEDRNFNHLKESLPHNAQIEAMPVERGDAGAASYAQRLTEAAGAPPVIDVIHLGLGADGHTASLVPGDPVLAETRQTVAWTRPYQGLRRMTLTYPVLDAARLVFWLVTGANKHRALRQLLAGDSSIAAAHVSATCRLVIADADAARGSDACP